MSSSFNNLTVQLTVTACRTIPPLQARANICEQNYILIWLLLSAGLLTWRGTSTSSVACRITDSLIVNRMINS